MGIPLFCKVAELRRGDTWLLPPARTDKHVDLYAFFSTLEYRTTHDLPIWLVDGTMRTQFISSEVWNASRLIKPLVTWSKFVWHKARIPRHASTAWLFVLNRNPTLDRLSLWGVDVEALCLLCGMEPERRDHLFFKCPFSADVWSFLMAQLRFTNFPSEWLDVMQWLSGVHTSKVHKLALFQAWQGALYYLWQEHNLRFHDGLSNNPDKVFSQIRSVLILKAMALSNNGSRLEPPLLSYWAHIV